MIAKDLSQAQVNLLHAKHLASARIRVNSTVHGQTAQRFCLADFHDNGGASIIGFEHLTLAEKEQLAAKMEEVVSPYRAINLQRAAKEVQELAVKVLTDIASMIKE